MKKVEELKDLGCSVRGRFYDLAWSKPVLRAPAVHGVSSNYNNSPTRSWADGAGNGAKYCVSVPLGPTAPSTFSITSIFVQSNGSKNIIMNK
mgnify:CR=1 FL=1